jgi:hypothetical protein
MTVLVFHKKCKYGLTNEGDVLLVFGLTHYVNKIYAQEISDILRSADDIKTSQNISSVSYEEEQRPFPLGF